MREYTYIEVAQYIGDNYKFFNSVAKGITKSKHSADDLISTIIIQLYNFKKTFQINSMNGYIYTMLRNEFINKGTEFHRQYNKVIYTELPLSLSNKENVEENKREDLSNEIIKYVQNSNEITWFQKKIWLLYYQNEHFADIAEMSKEEVDKIRKMSYRRLQKKLLINHKTLYLTVNEVNEKLKLKELFKNKI